MDLPIIAHMDLPGNYRLIRIQSAELCRLVQAGGELLINSATRLPYFRHSVVEEKVDFLFYLTPATQSLITEVMITQAHWQTWLLPVNHGTTTVSILACSCEYLARGLSIALDETLHATINLFLFELNTVAPFKLQPSQFYLSYMPAGTIANMALLEDQQRVGRFCSAVNLPGCFDGSLSELIAAITTQLPQANIISGVSSCKI